MADLKQAHAFVEFLVSWTPLPWRVGVLLMDEISLRKMRDNLVFVQA